MMKKNIKKLLRKLIRNILELKESETVEDGIRRKWNHLLKRAVRRNISESEFRNDLRGLGIQKGDVVVVHSSWSGMFSLDVQLDDVINILLDMVGRDGTIVMPCYPTPSDNIDLDNFHSCTGVLSELFRIRENVVISVFPKFSMAAVGRYARDIVGNHINSVYQFDECSPYYIAMKKFNAKVLMLGMGKHPHKISIFHCATYKAREINDFYRACYKNNKRCSVKYKGRTMIFDYIDRVNNCANDKRKFRNLFTKVRQQSVVLPGYSLVLFDARDAFGYAYQYCLEGGKLYRYH